MKLANKSHVTQQHRQLLWIPILHYFSITILQKYYTEICLQEKKKYQLFSPLFITGMQYGQQIKFHPDVLTAGNPFSL